MNQENCCITKLLGGGGGEAVGGAGGWVDRLCINQYYGREKNEKLS